MKVKIIKTYDTPTHKLLFGRTYDLEPSIAEAVVDSAHGEFVTEAAVVKPPETASTRPKTTRKRKG